MYNIHTWISDVWHVRHSYVEYSIRDMCDIHMCNIHMWISHMNANIRMCDNHVWLGSAIKLSCPLTLECCIGSTLHITWSQYNSSGANTTMESSLHLVPVTSSDSSRKKNIRVRDLHICAIFHISYEYYICEYFTFHMNVIDVNISHFIWNSQIWIFHISDECRRCNLWHFICHSRVK